LTLQIGLQFAGQPPAIDFCLHALQCSALDAYWQRFGKKAAIAAHGYEITPSSC
jgi:hypothetical protein